MPTDPSVGGLNQQIPFCWNSWKQKWQTAWRFFFFLRKWWFYRENVVTESENLGMIDISFHIQFYVLSCPSWCAAWGRINLKNIYNRVMMHFCFTFFCLRIKCWNQYNNNNNEEVFYGAIPLKKNERSVWLLWSQVENWLSVNVSCYPICNLLVVGFFGWVFFCCSWLCYSQAPSPSPVLLNIRCACCLDPDRHAV